MEYPVISWSNQRTVTALPAMARPCWMGQTLYPVVPDAAVLHVQWPP